MTLWKLFTAFLQIGLFSIGGGYAAMPLIQNQIVDVNHWLTLTEFADVVTIAEMTPGPISLNAASFVGTRISGFTGAVTATVGCILPSCIIVSILAFLYLKFNKLTVINNILTAIRPAVVGMIASAALTIIKVSFFGSNFNFGINFVSIGIFITALLLLRKFKLNPIIIMCASGLAGGVIYSLISL